MNKQQLIGAFSAVVFSLVSLSSHAALVGRDLDGNNLTAEAWYDTVANLTWLADANAGVGSAYDTFDPGSGRMNWADANAWAANLDIDGVAGPDGWRLPTTQQPDASCAQGFDPGGGFGTQNFGDNCTGSEMGNLYYNVLGNAAGSLTNTGPFSNVQSTNIHWSSTEYAPDPGLAWFFRFGKGFQSLLSKGDSRYAWAVQSGNVGAAVVPVPAAVWLFGSGLLGLIGVGRQRRRC